MILRLGLILLFSMLAVSPAAVAQEDVPEIARSLMEEAERARDINRVDEAIAKYSRVIEVAPGLTSAYVNLGALYFKQGKVEDAYKVFKQGVERSRADRTLLSNAAAAAQQLGKSAEALTFVDRALEASARDASLHALRGTILRTLQRNDEALAAQRKAVELSPDDAKLQFSLGNLEYSLGKREEAIAAFSRAIDLDRTYIRAYYNLGAVLFESGRYDEALSAYRIALAPVEQSFARKEKVDPIHARAYTNLGAIYLRQKQYPQAADAYQKALLLEPSNAAAQYNLAFVDYSAGKLDRAEQGYRAALAKDPSLPLAYVHLADIALRRNDATRAIQLVNEGMPRYDKETRFAALKVLGRAQVARGDRAAARATYQEIASLAPDDVDAIVQLTYDRYLTARESGDLAGQRIALETLMARNATDAMRAEHAVILVSQGDFDAARGELALINDKNLATLRAVINGQSESRDVSPLAAAVLEALNGRREPAARVLSQMQAPLAKGNAGLLYWLLGREAEARTHLTAARVAATDWPELSLALGELAISARRFDEAIDLLGAVKCDAPPHTATAAGTLELTLGKNDDLCARQRRALGTALLSQAADDLASSPRRARTLAERAAAMSLDPRTAAVATFIRGTAELATGDNSEARASLTRAIEAGLSQNLESVARRNLEAAQPREEPQVAEPTSSQSRRVVVVFLPDAPAENDRRLAEAVNGMLAPSAIPLQVEFFRRADDARSFLASNRDNVGVVIANPEFASNGFVPRYSFSRDGRQTYRRVIVVNAKSAFRSASDLRGKSVSVVEIFDDVPGTTTVRVPDDLTAIANVLYGKSDAAIVSEANPLLAQRASDLRIVATSAAQPLPVVAFAPMPEADRSALDATLRGARSSIGNLVSLIRDPAPAPKREIAYVNASALGLRPLDPPQSVALRVIVELPKIEIPAP